VSRAAAAQGTASRHPLTANAVNFVLYEIWRQDVPHEFHCDFARGKMV